MRGRGVAFSSKVTEPPAPKRVDVHRALPKNRPSLVSKIAAQQEEHRREGEAYMRTIPIHQLDVKLPTKIIPELAAAVGALKEAEDREPRSARRQAELEEHGRTPRRAGRRHSRKKRSHKRKTHRRRR